MRFAIGATVALAAAVARADDASSSEPASSSTSVAKPTFTPTELKAPFLEQFTDDWESRWNPSHAKKDVKADDEEWAYVGTWSVEEPAVLKGMEGDKGLVIKDKAAHHAISAKFPKAIDNKDDTLVVQYEVKLQDGLECGGAYMKLLQDNAALHAEEFSNASPYIIMFGPDKCGATNKVHFIFRHKNPKTGEYEEKHLKNPPMARIVKTTSLYTLIVKPDQSFEMKIDGESVRNGTLLEDFTPSVNPEAEIDDPNDTKPEDWVDDARIADPEATKPEDWDEDAPFEIVDEEATKPEDWLEDEPTTIPDPEAEKPEDWDDEEDGDWVPPTVPNPKCDEVSGCGKCLDTSFDSFPANDKVDPDAYKSAIDALNPGDAITIFTPDPTHFPIAKYAIERGIHVMITKPAVKALEEHQELVDLAQKKGVYVYIEHHKRYDPAYADARAKAQKLGDFNYFYSYMSQPKSQLETFKAWAGKESDISYYLNSHHIDINDSMVQERGYVPVSVNASSSKGVAVDLGCDPVTEDTISLLVTWNKTGEPSKRAVGVYTASWTAPQRAGVHSNQYFHYLAANGEIRVDQAKRGYDVADDSAGQLMWYNPFYMKYAPDEDGNFAGQTGYGYISIEKFVDGCRAVNSGKLKPADLDAKPLPTLKNTIATTAILEAGRRSIDENREIKIVIKDGKWSLE